MRIIPLIASLGLIAACASSPPRAGAGLDGSADASAPAQLRRGINLGNALDAPAEGDWGVVLQPAHFQLAAKAGFDHVRLPVRFSAHALDAAPYSLDETFMMRLDWALDQAAANGLGVLVDLHHYDQIHTAPAAHRDRFLAIWRQIATRWADRPASVAFEPLNEPHGALTAAAWNQLAADVLAAIREIDPDRLVVLGGISWSDAIGLDTLTLPAGDTNLLATFHAYEPKLFSVQGAPWMGAEWTTTGVVFPGPPPAPLQPTVEAGAVSWVKDWFDRYNTLPAATNPSGPSTVKAEMDAAVRFSSRTGIATYIGEFAAVDWADLPSRVSFYAEVRAQAESLGIGWCVWDDGGHNRFLDIAGGTWSPELHAALFP